MRYLSLTILCAAATLLVSSGVAHADGPAYKVRTPEGEVRYTSTLCDGCTLLAVLPGTSSATKKKRGRTRTRAHTPPTSTTPHKQHARFERHIRAASKKHGVPVAFIKAVIHVESRFNPRATSHVGAMGLMQLMPGTARDMGVTKPYDPRQNIFGGTRYLALLTEKYDGDINQILAGYNAGPGNVDDYGGIPWRATRGYVQDVYHWYKIYRALESQ